MTKKLTGEVSVEFDAQSQKLMDNITNGTVTREDIVANLSQCAKSNETGDKPSVECEKAAQAYMAYMALNIFSNNEMKPITEDDVNEQAVLTRNRSYTL